MGHFIGASFKPWQAVNIAKNIGNFAKVLGPITAVFSIDMEVADSVKQAQREEEERNRKREVVSSFTERADAVVALFKSAFDEYTSTVITSNLNEIRARREQRTASMKLTSKTAVELKACVAEFKALLAEC